MYRDIVKESFDMNLRLLQLCAIYPPSLKFCSRKTFKIYAYFIFIVITVGFPFLGIFQLITNNNLNMNEVTDNLFVSSQLSLFPFKYAPFLLKYEELEKLMTKLKMKSFTNILPEQAKYIQRSVDTCKIIFKLFCGLCTGCCFFYAFRPVYMNIPIPTQIWWPTQISHENTISKCVAWMYCAYSGCNGVLCTSAVDTLISGLIIHVSGQIKILKNNLTFLGKRAEEAASSLEGSRKDLRKRIFIEQKLLEYADHYNDIIEFIQDVENLLSLSVFVQIVGSSVVICMMCYMLTLLKFYSLAGISFTVYIMSMFAEVFFFCFFGNNLIAESNTISEAIFKSDWYTYQPSSKKILILIMERAKKPLVQKAGKVLTLSLPLFVAVLKQAYSLMAVLQSRNDTN